MNAPENKEIRRERIAVGSCFSILGFACAAWVASIPDVKTLLGLDDAKLGLLLVFGPVGTFLSFFALPPLFEKLGSRRVLLASLAAYIAALGAIGACFFSVAPFAVWCVSIAAMGAAGNIANVSMNTQAGIVERHAGRSIMNSFHAAWSVSNLVGLALALAVGAGLMRFGAHARFAATVLVCAALYAAMRGKLPQSDPQAPARRNAQSRVIDRRLVSLGILAAIYMGCEGAVFDWIGVFFRETLAAGNSFYLLGPCSVMAAITAGRLATDSIVNKTSAKFVLKAYGLLLSAGLSILLASPFIPAGFALRRVAAVFACAATGLGLSGLVPVIFAQTAKSKTTTPGTALTIVSSIGFSGYFLAPPLTGFVSQRFSLSAAFGIFAILAALGALLFRQRD